MMASKPTMVGDEKIVRGCEGSGFQITEWDDGRVMLAPRIGHPTTVLSVAGAKRLVLHLQAFIGDAELKGDDGDDE